MKINAWKQLQNTRVLYSIYTKEILQTQLKEHLEEEA